MVHRAGYPGRMGPPQGGDGGIVLLDLTASDVPSYVTFTRASNATEFNSAGSLITASTNVARFDYNPLTLQPRGFLLEGARTNAHPHSNDFSSSMTLQRVTVTAASATSPDGTNNATLLKEDGTAANTHSLDSASISYTFGTSYTLSIFAKQGVGTRNIVLALSSVRFTTSQRVAFNPTTGEATIVTGTPTTRSEQLSNGWWRFSITATATSTGTASFFVNLADGTNITYNGDNTSGVLIYGVQHEAGAFASSYIPTTGAAATRAADSALISLLSSFGYNNDQGTILVEFESMAEGASQYILSLGDGGSTNAIELRRGIGSPIQIVSAYNIGGTNQANGLVAQSLSALTIGKLGFAYQTNNFAYSLNGSSTSVDTSGNVTSVFTNMRLGASQTAGNQLFGWLRRVTYFPVRLSDAQIQALTA